MTRTQYLHLFACLAVAMVGLVACDKNRDGTSRGDNRTEAGPATMSAEQSETSTVPVVRDESDTVSVARSEPGAASVERDVVTVTRGFVFIDGQYVPLPYRVAIQGDTVTINGQVVYWQWRPYQWPAVAEDPGVPDWVTEDTPLNKLVSSGRGPDREPGLAIRKWHYLENTYPPDQAVEEMVAYLRALPFMESVEVDEVQEGRYFLDVSLKTKHGKNDFGITFGSCVCMEDEEGEEYDPDAELEKAKENQVSKLSKNLALFYRNGSQHFSMREEKLVARNLFLLISTVQSDLSTQEKARVAYAMGMSGPWEFVENFRHSEELAERLEGLRTRLRVAPATRDEVINELPAKFREDKSWPRRPD